MTTTSNLTCGLQVNLRLKVPSLFGFRVKIATVFCTLAAWSLGGKLIVAIEPEVSGPK